jgi:hypothetical protein
LGELENGFYSSKIMNEHEVTKLVEFVETFQSKLIYRATRDGFQAEKFHLKCDDINNTVTIVMNDLGYVFGGYASVNWNSRFYKVEDSNAFIFSLRRYHRLDSQKFMIKSPKYAINASQIYGPSFGEDIVICDKSNENYKNSSDLGYAFDLPKGYSYKSEYTRSFIAGSHKRWKTKEIEVYQINK